MIEQEKKQKKRRKRGKKKKATGSALDQTINIKQENLDIEEPVTKKMRLDSQEESTLQVCTKTRFLNSEEIISDTRVSDHSNLILDLQQAVSNEAKTSLDANGIKTYTITEKDLIQLARTKENEQYVNGTSVEKHIDERPFITFSILGNDIVHLELIRSKENEQDEVIENKKQIRDFKGHRQIENSNKSNGRIESLIKLENDTENSEMNEIDNQNDTLEIFKENDTENSEINEIDNQASFNENSEEYDQIIQNGDVENFNDEDSFKQLLRPTSLNHLPPELEKFWYRRYILFSLYDKGIMMDEEGWYSVTPEYLAEYIAKRCACDTIIDAMCGVGGNAIQFAKTCKKVIAIDINETKLNCARNNARIYGVDDKIDFILGDFYDLIPELKADVVFLSPPWGGLSYLDSEVYDIKTMVPVDGERLFRESRKITKNIAYYVPRSINIDQMKKLCDFDETCEFQQVIAWEKIRSYMVYYGDLAGNSYSEVVKLDHTDPKKTKKRKRKRNQNHMY